MLGNDALVLKLGGSLIENQTITPWLDAAIGAARDTCVLIVVGGGSLADAVRSQQRRLKYNDALAHRLAILAMQQNAWLVLSFIEQRVEHLSAKGRVRTMPVQTRSECELAVRGSGVAVWLPDEMTTGADEIEQSWRMTSDALAVWLSTTLSVPNLAIAKSGAPAGIDQGLALDHDDPRSPSVTAMADHGVVDALFPHYIERYAGHWSVISDPLLIKA